MDYCGPFTAHSGYCERLKAFISINMQWIQDQIETQPNSPYWHQVCGLLGLFYHTPSPLWILTVNCSGKFVFCLFSVRYVWHCCSWKVWRTATTNSCHFLLVHSHSTHLASCKWRSLFLNEWILCTVNKMINVLFHCCVYVYSSRLFQLGGDLEDLESALNKSSQIRPLGSGSCSALIKLLPNNEELLVSHDTWNTYQSMLRIIKKYIFAFQVSPVGN